jgi:hypothetical protein
MCLLFAVGCQFAHADDASKRAKIKEMFDVIHLHDTIEQMSNPQAMRKAILAMLPGAAGQTPEQQKNLDDLMVRVSQFMRETVNWQQLEPQYLDLYASTYSEEDVDGLLAFYRSPVGQSMIAKQPEITAKSQAITQERLREAMPQLLQLILNSSNGQIQGAKPSTSQK